MKKKKNTRCLQANVDHSIVTPTTTPELPGPEKAVASDLHTDCLLCQSSRKYGQELVLNAGSWGVISVRLSVVQETRD